MLLLKGLAAGSVSGLPLGPMGIRCLHDTLRYGRKAGLISAAGIAIALGLWAALLSLVFENTPHWMNIHQNLIQTALGAIIILIGTRSLSHHTPPNPSPQGPRTPRLQSLLSTFLVVAGNPMTPLTLAAVFTILGLVETRKPSTTIGLGCAVGCGAMLLWIVLTQLTCSLGRKAGTSGARLMCSGLSRILILLGITQTLLGLLRTLNLL